MSFNFVENKNYGFYTIYLGYFLLGQVEVNFKDSSCLVFFSFFFFFTLNSRDRDIDIM